MFTVELVLVLNVTEMLFDGRKTVINQSINQPIVHVYTLRFIFI